MEGRDKREGGDWKEEAKSDNTAGEPRGELELRVEDTEEGNKRWRGKGGLNTLCMGKEVKGRERDGEDRGASKNTNLRVDCGRG